jgi:lon-related putative ATP-dependent protease
MRMAEGVLLRQMTKETSTIWRTTGEIPIPERLIDQVIGQERAVEIVRLAARQRRSILLLGEPGTGKSMLGRAMTEWISSIPSVDVLLFPQRQDSYTLSVQTVPAGEGRAIVLRSGKGSRQQQMARRFLLGLLMATLFVVSAFFSWKEKEPLYLGMGLSLGMLLFWIGGRASQTQPGTGPRLLIDRSSSQLVPFVDATGLHAGGLLGDVRHDPYQSGKFATSSHQLVEPGAIHSAHGGVLFIDELATLDLDTQQRLLTAFQEKELAITGRNVGSSGSMVRTEPLPCDFILVLAGNIPDLEKLHPALRSRIRGYGYEIVMADCMEDNPANQEKLARFVAQEVNKDGRIPHFTREAVEVVVEQARTWAGKPRALTTRFRELGGLVRAAGDVAVAEGESLVLPAHVKKAIGMVLSVEEQLRK